MYGTGTDRALTNSTRRGSWDSKVTKIKKPDGTIIIERTDSSGNTTRTVEGGPGGMASSSNTSPSFAGSRGSNDRSPTAAASPTQRDKTASFPQASFAQEVLGLREVSISGLGQRSYTDANDYNALENPSSGLSTRSLPESRVRRATGAEMPAAGGYASSPYSTVERGSWSSPSSTNTTRGGQGAFVGWNSN